MLTSYCVEYSLHFRRHPPTDRLQYFTDDPVACEQFVEELLERGMGIHAIRHDGADLPQAEFDRFVKLAASALASKAICTSLSIKPEEEHFRFGFAA